MDYSFFFLHFFFYFLFFITYLHTYPGRVYKHVLRNSDQSSVQLLPSLLTQMTSLYSRHALSPALNMVRICIKDYASGSNEVCCVL